MSAPVRSCSVHMCGVTFIKMHSQSAVWSTRPDVYFDIVETKDQMSLYIEACVCMFDLKDGSPSLLKKTQKKQNLGHSNWKKVFLARETLTGPRESYLDGIKLHPHKIQNTGTPTGCCIKTCAYLYAALPVSVIYISYPAHQ